MPACRRSPAALQTAWRARRTPASGCGHHPPERTESITTSARRPGASASSARCRARGLWCANSAARARAAAARCAPPRPIAYVPCSTSTTERHGKQRRKVPEQRAAWSSPAPPTRSRSGLRAGGRADRFRRLAHERSGRRLSAGPRPERVGGVPQAEIQSRGEVGHSRHTSVRPVLPGGACAAAADSCWRR